MYALRRCFYFSLVAATSTLFAVTQALPHPGDGLSRRTEVDFVIRVDLDLPYLAPIVGFNETFAHLCTSFKEQRAERKPSRSTTTTTTTSSVRVFVAHVTHASGAARHPFYAMQKKGMGGAARSEAEAALARAEARKMGEYASYVLFTKDFDALVQFERLRGFLAAALPDEFLTELGFATRDEAKIELEAVMSDCNVKKSTIQVRAFY